MGDFRAQPLRTWTESEVRDWLKSIEVKDCYINKLSEEEVDGKILLSLDEEFLTSKFGIKPAPAHYIIQKRDELIGCREKREEAKTLSDSKAQSQKKSKKKSSASSPPTLSEHPDVAEKTHTAPVVCAVRSKEDCKPRPFDKDAIDFIYVKHRVLEPESGAFNLIFPCREYKSLATAVTLDRQKLQAKFAREVFKFATGCMNIRSNGTIHFGVMDSKEDKGYVHGEIIGIPVIERDVYMDALDHAGKSFSSDRDHVQQCVRPPRFIEVMDRDGAEKRYVVEVDIVPSISIVKGKVYQVRLPNFRETTNKVEFEKEVIYRRTGSKTEPVSDKDLNEFYLRVKDRDAQREEAEKNQYVRSPGICPDLGRKLKVLLTSGKKFIENDKWFILVTNRFRAQDLSHIDWLLNMNVFCVFDFDPDSKVSGLCGKFLEHHAVNLHFLQSYGKPTDMTVKEFTSKLHLFDQTSWIFCNGRSDYKGHEKPCDEMTWIQTKVTLLRDSVALICKQILPKGTFQVIFLFTSPVEKPLLHTFNEFFTDMEGHEDIVCICESENDFSRFQSFAEGSCTKETIDNSSVVGMKMSHVDATVQQIQTMKGLAKKQLPVFVKGTCLLEKQEEEQMYSLEILATNHCNETNEDFIAEEKENIERQFYRGGRVAWLNFWLAEKKYVGEVIERDAYNEVITVLESSKTDPSPVNVVNIYHHPGSGGSTVARQVLWNKRSELRCAVVNPSYQATVVAQHAVQLREYQEQDAETCLPVLLLVEDIDHEYLDILKNELEVASNVKKIQSGTLCFILLICRRSHNPEKRCRESPLQNVSVTHKLSPAEKRNFAAKKERLQEQYEPQFILTFVLMSQEFSEDYVHSFVAHLLQGIDHQSVTTRLILYVALLNTYVQNSFISQSHCEALLALKIRLERFRQHTFENSLGDQGKLVFMHLKDDKTHIESIRIIHPVVAKEILKQLLENQQTQSELAMKLLRERVLFEHRFGRDDYLAFLRALFIRRYRISKGDEYDSLFSPLIDHVREKEKSPEKAIALLEEAFERFNRDAFIAQQLARLYYSYEKFEEAERWAQTAVQKLPNNSYLLDTKGRVYKKWFEAKCKAIDQIPKTVQNTAEAVETALAALECFQACEKAAQEEIDNINSSGYFAEVEVGCSLLRLITSLQVFKIRSDGHSECMKYLLTDYIPDELKDAWEPFHGRLKKLHKTIQDALEWISEDLSYFQTDSGFDEEEAPESPEEKISHPLSWLAKKSAEYGMYYCTPSPAMQQQNVPTISTNLTPFQKRMMIYKMGLGNVTSILSKLTDRRDAADRLRDIISLYPENPLKANMVQRDIVNYIMSHITLNCLSPQKGAPSLNNLQALCRQFLGDKRKCFPSMLFLLTLLFWPDDQDTAQDKENKYEVVQSAVEHMGKTYWDKMKDIPPRKRRIYTHFLLGTGGGLSKFVHKKKFESITKDFPVSQKRLVFLSGEAWKKPEIGRMLKRVSGRTEDGVVYLQGPKKDNFRILPLHLPSVPHSNENITFYLGFTFRGPVAYDISVLK